ncbi:hypothetical protein Dimus_028794 [Dionaea muscipula]
MDWPSDVSPTSALKVIDVVPIVMCAEDGCFPGLYCSSFLTSPWLSDGCTMILSSMWRSSEVIISVDILTGKLARITPQDSNDSWNVLSLDKDNIIAVHSSPVHVPQIKYGSLCKEAAPGASWNWQHVPGPIYRCSEKVRSLLSALQFSLLKIPVRAISENSTAGTLFIAYNSKSFFPSNVFLNAYQIDIIS